MEFEKMTLKELQKLAKDKNIKNRTKMNKAELIKALKALKQKPDSKKEQVIREVKELPKVSSITSMSNVRVEEKPPAEKKEVKKEEYPIPERYDIDSLVLLPVGPSLEYSYWQISTQTRWQYKDYLAKSNYNYRLKFFVKDEEGSRELQEIEIGDYGNYYFHHYLPGKIAWVEAGFMSDEGIFIPIISSKRIIVPRDALSTITDETFMTVQENYMEILRLSGIDSDIHPGSIGFHKGLLKHLLKELGSKGLFSKGK